MDAWVAGTEVATGAAMNGALISIAVLQVVAVVIGLVRGKVLSHLLGPAHFGVVSTIDQIVVMLVNLGSFSLTFTAGKFISRSHSVSHERFEATSAGILRGLFGLSVLTTLLASAMLWVDPGVFGADLQRYHYFIQIALLSIPAVMLHMLVIGTLAAAQRPVAAAGLSLFVAFVLAVVAAVGVKVSGLSGLYVATAVMGTTTLIGSIAYMRYTLRIRIFRLPVRLIDELRRHPQIVSFSLYIYVAQATISVAMLATRYVVLSRLGEVSAGLLQASLSIALTVGAVLTPMTAFYLMPLVNRRSPAREKAQAANDFAANMLILLFLGALPVVLFPRVLIGLMYTGAFAGAAATIFVFVLWQCIFQIANVYQQLLIGLDDVFFMAISATLSFGIVAGLMPVLVPRAGLAGAAIALCVGMVLYGLLAAIRLRSRFGLQIPARVATRAAFVGVSVLGAGLIFGTETERSISGLGLRVGYLGFMTAVLWFSLRHSERELITSAPATLRRLWRSRERAPSAAP